MPAVADARGTFLTVAPGNLAHPVDRVAAHAGHLGRGHATAEQPQDLPLTPGDRIHRPSIPLLEFGQAQVPGKLKSSCHSPSLYPESVSTELGTRDRTSLAITWRKWPPRESAAFCPSWLTISSGKEIGFRR